LAGIHSFALQWCRCKLTDMSLEKLVGIRRLSVNGEMIIEDGKKNCKYKLLK